MSGARGCTLAVSASGARLLCALQVAPEPNEATGARIEVATPANPQRGADLVQCAQLLLERCGLELAAVDELIVDVGPGSYTGLRVAVTFARFVAAFGRARLRSVTSTELFALTAWRRGLVRRDRAIRCVLDARRGRAHVARLHWDHDSVRPDDGPRSIELAALHRITDGPDTTWVVDPALRSVEAVAGTPDLAGISRHETIDLPMPAPIDLFDPALAPLEAELDALEPLYLMASYAED
ncbi:MAG: tRNA (adenosine(37)-N6)-threonylcarbamoyltransferase complex dimerization subunit type 1 TsaB [Planctomycetes bacterium]|nr:tRNA (adenosine(37)-N6)-threonylcarbamoyltransferase complex dimerization subunit type 1 TsaB [Planctomycetota bacterium]